MFSSSIPAPASAIVHDFASRFPGLGVVAVRRSSRSFSGWVCVCSFASENVARAFASRAASGFFGPGCFCYVRRACRGRFVRFRVSVPCLPPRSLVVLLRPRFVRCGRFRVRCPGSSPAAMTLAASLRSPVSTLLRGVVSVGVSGSRSPSPAAVSALCSALSAVSSARRRVSVGCATGVDSVVRRAFAGSPSLLVFSAASPRFARAGALAALALRSAACVRSVARGSRGLLLVLPSGACPAGVAPGRSFRGCGSGSWGSAALGVGLGRRVLVWLPVSVSLPVWPGFSWVAVGSGWWLCSPIPPAAVQLSLF